MYLEHLVAFAIVGYFIGLFFFRAGIPIGDKSIKRINRRYSFGLFLLGLLPVIGEVAQLFIPDSPFGLKYPLFFKFEFADILWNFAGEMLGLAIYRTFKYLS